MTGTNILKLNQATMTLAVQEYLDKRWKDEQARPMVRKVLWDGSSSSFEVTTETTVIPF